MVAWLCLVTAAGVFGAPSCGGTSDDLCTAICDCIGCGDIDEEEQCSAISGSEDMAEAYGCEAEWEDVATCMIDNGECDEDTGRYTTSRPGSCSGRLDTGFPCAVVSDCPFSGATCNATAGNQGTCQAPACSGPNMIQCNNDSDCPAGEDRCIDELVDLAECLDDASDDSSIALGVLYLLGGGVPPDTSTSVSSGPNGQTGPGQTVTVTNVGGGNVTVTNAGGFGGVGGVGGVGGFGGFGGFGGVGGAGGVGGN